MKLEMQGKLKTEDPVSKYLEGVPADKAEITLHQTLTHTAGFINYSGGDYVVSERDETMKRILAAPLTHKPGTRYAYSNSGYSVLAAIVEKVSGLVYERFLNENLLKPAGMTSTGYVLPKFEKAKLPHAYDGDKDLGTALDYKWSPTGPYWNLFGNGGIFSTTGDLFKWYQALQGEKVLSVEAKKKLFTPFLNDYAYGWNVERTPQGLLIGHNGASDNGFNANVGFFSEKKIFGAVLSNAGTFYGSAIYSDLIMNKIGRMLAGEEFTSEIDAKFITPADGNLSKLAGTYRMEGGDELKIASVGGNLTIEPIGQSAVAALGTLSKFSAPEYEEANASAAAVVKAFIAVDFEPLKGKLANPENFERFKTLLTERIAAWESSDGKLKAFRVAGTAPTWWSTNQVPATFVQLKFERKDRLFRLHWRDGKITGIGGAAIAAPITIPMRPISETDFIGWHLVTSQKLRVKFSHDGQTIRVTAGERTVSAIKV